MKKSLKVFFMSLTVVIFGLPSCYSLKRRSAKNKEFAERVIAVNVGADFGYHDPSGSSRASTPTSSISSLFSFVKIPAGEFTMGKPSFAPGTSPIIRPVKVVEIRNAFMIMRTEVTQRQYVAVTGENPSYFKGPQYCDNYDKRYDMCPDHPVERVSWNDVQKFIRKLNNNLARVEGCKGIRRIQAGCYRLPTEAEWVWAAGGGQNRYFFSNTSSSILKKYAIFRPNSGKRTHKVKGNRLPNKLGLYDMLGNVAEWCQDKYVRQLPGGKDPLVTGSSLNSVVMRGGSFDSHSDHLSKHQRFSKPMTTRDSHVGFRLVRTL